MSVDPSAAAIDSNSSRVGPDRDSAARAGPEADNRLDLTAIGWLVLVIVGLGGFAVMTLLMLQHVVWSFDQTLNFGLFFATK